MEKLMPLVYEQLRELAHRYMKRENAGHILQTTALVHEAYLRLVDDSDRTLQNRQHFFALAAQVMRHLLVDHARASRYAKRGGDARLVSLDESAIFSIERSEELLSLDEALERLSAVDPRKSRIVELRYFIGLSVEETAEAMSLSPITVKREWFKAKAWLSHQLKMGNDRDTGALAPN
ncbi:sigma-70 family RNA polymerase sigma factor [bacterium]|nr:sigma-70 family RNA polymerase sigma factor [bacterium]